MMSPQLRCTLLCAWMVWTVCACKLENLTLWIERQDFEQCVAVNTTICSGYCYTQDTNLKGRFGRTFLIQRSCVPRSLVFRAVPGDPEDVSSPLYYPVARRCSCRRCDTRTHHCVSASPLSYNRCTLDGIKRKNQAVET